MFINHLTPSSRLIFHLPKGGCNWAGRELYRVWQKNEVFYGKHI